MHSQFFNGISVPRNADTRLGVLQVLTTFWYFASSWHYPDYKLILSLHGKQLEGRPLNSLENLLVVKMQKHANMGLTKGLPEHEKLQVAS